MQLVSSSNEINYGSYDDGLEWNIHNYQLPYRGKNLAGEKILSLLKSSLRINVFTEKILAELELLQSDDTLRIALLGYDLQHDLYLQKTWLLTSKQFAWEGCPQKYQIAAKKLGLCCDVHCEAEGQLGFHFDYFDHYQFHFASDIQRSRRRPLCNANPYDIHTWSFSEKQAMLHCRSLELRLDGNDYAQAAESPCNISYEWCGGHFPAVTKELSCQFWQPPAQLAKQQPVQQPVQLGPLPAEQSAAGCEIASLPFAALPDKGALQMAGTLLLLGHDSCSSESAIWVEHKIRYRLPRIVPRFGRSPQNLAKRNLLPDLDWEFTAGDHFHLHFQPFGVSDTPQLVFPQTQNQRIYGSFSGKLLDQFGDIMPIARAIGFIDYREIRWRK